MRKNSIFLKCAAIMSAMAIVQIIVFFCTAAASGVLNAINSGEEQVLCSYAEKGGMYIRNEMLKSAASIDFLAEGVNAAAKDVLKDENLTAEQFFDSPYVVNEYLETVSGKLLEYMRLNSVNGTFVVLCGSRYLPDEQKDGTYKGVFFKDTNLYDFPEDHSDIMLLRGSSLISSRYKVPLDLNWNNEFKHRSSEKNSMDYFFEPIKAAYEYPNASADSLGYWSSEFTFANESTFDKYSVISYSVPLILEGQIYGAVGVCVSPDSLISLLPSDGSGYMLVTSNGDVPSGSYEADIQAVSKSPDAADSAGNRIKISKTSYSTGVFSIKNLTAGGSVKYCAAGEIGLYGGNSPFGNVKWLLLSVETENALFGASKKLGSRLISAVVISAVIAIVIAVTAAKLIFSPIEQLAEEAENFRTGSVIPLLETNDAEINSISKLLNRLSEENSEHENEMNAEKERYMTALRAARSDIFDYTPATDTFTMYRFSADGASEQEERSSTEGFRALVESGKVCPKDDIPAMLAFIEGKSEKNFEIRTYRKDGSLRWNGVNSKSIKNEDGEIIRVIASSSDITAKKEAELKRLDKERRDSVTGVYNSEYGIILAEKCIVERGSGDYTALAVLLGGANEFINKYGIYCFNGALEEIGKTALFVKHKNDVVWRTNACLISALIPEASSDKLWDRIENFLSRIKAVYCSDDPGDGICCHIGVSSNKAGTPRSAAFDNALKAALATDESKKYSVEYYNGAETDEKSGKAKKADAPAEISGPKKVYAVTDDVVSYALKMLVKAENIKKTSDIILRKAVRVLGLDRAVLYEIDVKNRKLVFFCGCNSCAENSSYIFSDISLTDFDTAEGRAILESSDTITMGKDFYMRSEKLRAETSKFRKDGSAVLVPITDKMKIVGFAAFACSPELCGAELKETLMQLSKVMGAYIIESKASSESRRKNELLSKVSDEIRDPVNTIIEAAESKMENSDEISAEEALLAIKRSADSLSKIIDSIPINKL